MAPLPDISQLDSKGVIIKEAEPKKLILLPKIDSVNQVGGVLLRKVIITCLLY